jgi:ABC-type Na+ transport system ATPase subunit NatA
MDVIDIHDLTKIYKGTRGGRIVALDNVSLAIRQGEIFALLGPNGAGKTTLFKALLNIVRSNSGSISINGYPPSNPESRRKVGYLAENHRFPDYVTGLGLIQLTARLHGNYGSQTKARAKELLNLVAMSNWENAKIKKYSKGMLQRIGLAQAMVIDLSKGHLLKVSTIDELTRRSCQYRVEAALSGPAIQIPPEVGRVLSFDDMSMTVELKEERLINAVIDELRVRKIDIKSVIPIKMTLEQSFMEAIGDRKGESL